MKTVEQPIFSKKLLEYSQFKTITATRTFFDKRSLHASLSGTGRPFLTLRAIRPRMGMMEKISAYCKEEFKNESQALNGIHRIYALQVQQLYKHVHIGLIASLINSLILVFILWKLIPQPVLISWFSAILAISFFRFLLYFRFQRSSQAPSEVVYWERWFIVTMAVSGIIWGSAGIFLFPIDSIEHQIFLAFVLGGMVAGAAGTYSVIIKSFLAYSLPAIFPIIIKLFLIEDDIHIAMGGMTLLFWFLMFFTARRINTFTISSFKLQFENSNLIKYLSAKKICIEKLNKNYLSEINERKRTEEERAKLEDQLLRAQKMEAIGTLAGEVAHDLNNVLSGIVSYPELLLLDLPEDSPLKKPILTMQDSGKKAAAIVQDLLTLARRGVVTKEVVNLNDIITEYLKSPEHEKLRLYHPEVEIKTHIESDLLNISGSYVHLYKTVMNLISNAVEAMYDGGKILISAENRYIDRPIGGYDSVEEGDYIALTVSDTGIGILPQDMERIFEPFYTKKVMGKSGTGLGMAVVWNTVKDHKGYIDVQSTAGKGSAFTLYFPATRQETAKEKTLLPTKNYMGKGELILVIDDVKDQREITSAMLTALGYSVHAVSSGEKAIEYLKEHTVDLIVLDIIMDPGMDGLDTYRKILKLYPQQKAIITSGFSETDRVKEAQRLGAGAYVQKPYTLERIGLSVKAELEKE
jgi:signal transduction histidine kinase/ActR/RegA family two-component response regulator